MLSPGIFAAFLRSSLQLSTKQKQCHNLREVCVPEFVIMDTCFMSVHVYVDSSAAYLHRRDITRCMSRPIRHLFPFSSFEEISKNAFVILICTSAQLAYILPCVIKTVVLTYKLVLQYFVMSSFKKMLLLQLSCVNLPSSRHDTTRKPNLMKSVERFH